jgi:Uma2 family endonuclease
MTVTPLSLPTQDQLPCDDGIPMETQRHKMQMDLLIHALYPWLEKQNQGYIGGNMFIYYSAAQLKNQDFKGPDFFAVLDVPKVERKSWVVWEEGKTPDVIVELLSESTANYDKTSKKQIYQDQMRVPEYFWYDPFNPEDWAGFRLNGRNYQPITWEDKGFFCEGLQLYLTRWEGDYEGVTTTWLRWADLEGNVLPTRGEIAEQAQAEAQQAQAEAQQAQAENRKLAAKLREMGIDPNTL